MTFARIGRFALGAVPVEMSTTQGLRIREEFEPATYFQLLGLANQYASYVATASEYAAQDYMGASTLWGPQEGEFLKCTLLDLRDKEPTTPFSVRWLSHYVLDLGTRRFGPPYVGKAGGLPDEGLESILLNAWHEPQRQLPRFFRNETVKNDDEEYDAVIGRTFRVLHEEREPF